MTDTAIQNWNLRELKDTRENIIEQIKGAATVPETAKAALVEVIERNHSKSNLLRVDAHANSFEVSNGRKQSIINIHVSDL